MAGVENGFRAARNFFHSFFFSILISLTSLLQYLFPCMNIEYIFLTSTLPHHPHHKFSNGLSIIFQQTET